MVLPSAKVILTDGIVIVGSEPPRPGGGLPATLSTITTAIAPTFCAFLTLTVKLQVPRSISAILPEMAAPFVIAEQPSVGDDWTRFAVCPGKEIDGPKPAVPTW